MSHADTAPRGTSELGEPWAVSGSCWAFCCPSQRWALAVNAAPSGRFDSSMGLTASTTTTLRPWPRRPSDHRQPPPGSVSGTTRR